ncbi:hypothetical protein B4Q04_14795 [Zobellia sp. OII3]|uniref:hybrid sensor histidine kinase/response regulator transcription factor n=1 Tax=Zobellia sp. OII3 TaxID=2034520 RepID=UPI000B52F2C0|nr:two-component regulator propeller domain-containing protein [Zobellia sp. OII3]OWW24583.1 hypothetical protein B4Q04_14795 [Zobellia sp. OII3]
MSKNFYAIWILLFLTRFPIVFAQTLEKESALDFISITTEDGLSQNTIYSILKDRTGYLWFGTDDGLSRYNSYHVDIFKKSTSPLKGRKVYDMLEDTEGNIWLATDNGLKRYDPYSETIIEHELTGISDSRPHVNVLAFENDSLMWLGTTEGLLLYHLKKGILKTYEHDSNNKTSLSNSDVSSLAKDNDNLWVGTENGLNFLDVKTEKFTKYFGGSKKPDSLSGSHIKSLSLDYQGGLWIGTERQGISYFNKQKVRFENFNTKNSLLPHNEVRDIFYAPDGHLWIATNGGGLSKMDTENRSFTNYQHLPDHTSGLVTNSIYSVYEDREGVLWVGTYAGGVCFNSAKNDKFELIKHLTYNSNSISDSRIRSVYLDRKNKLWLGTWGGLNVYDPEKDKYTSYLYDRKNPSSLSFNTVTSIYEDYLGNIWVGTYSGGLNRLKPEKNGFIRYNNDALNPGGLSSDMVYCIIEDPENNLWIGTQEGLNLFDRSKQKFKSYSRKDIRDIRIGNDNTLVLATFGGICIFDTKTKSFKNYRSPQLSSFPISQVLLDKKSGHIWFSSLGGGMGYLDPRNSEFTIFTEKEGLPTNFVSSLIDTDDGSIWVSTFKGISKFNKATSTFENIGRPHKFPLYQFYPRASTFLPDNRLAFGGSKGLVIFNPESLLRKRTEPEIILTSLKIDNKEVTAGEASSLLKKSISKTDKLFLKPDQKDFSIDFVALDFKNPGGNQYAYILENYMDEWVPIGNNRTIGFTNLNHGNYVLKLKTLEASANVKALAIEIAPPFHATWWFRSLMVLLVLFLLYLYNKYTFISVQQKNALIVQRLKMKNKQDFNQMRLRFFTYISHELRTPLTLISDPLQQLVRYKKDPKQDHLFQLIDTSVARLLRLVDQILDISKLEGDTLSLQVSKQDIAAILEEATNAFREFAIQKGVRLEFIKEMETIEGWVDEDKIEKIVYNLLSNAFKFTPKNGLVSVGLGYYKKSKGHIVIEIKDTGIGIAKEKQHKIFEGFYQVQEAKSLNPNGAGIGLDYVKRLITLHHGSIALESEPEVGSLFSIQLPIERKYYQPKEIKQEEIVKTTLPLRPITVRNAKKTPSPLPVKVHSKSTPKILIVEDDVDIRSYIVSSLSDTFKVIEAPNGEEGLKLALEHAPELIMSDTLMPIMDGLQFCEAIKKNEKTRHIPFLFLSAWTSDEFKLRGLEIGANDYIAKPFDIQIVKARIENIIKNVKRVSEISKVKVNLVPDDTSVDSIDSLFIKKAHSILDENFDNPDFTTEMFKKKMGMSHSALYRKLKQLTGQSSNEFIRSYRLKRAAQIIRQDSGLLIAEICIKSGFNDPKYFSKCFKQEHMLTPSEYAKRYVSESKSNPSSGLP